MKNDENNLFLSLTKDRIFKIFFKGREDLVKSLLESFLPLPKGSVIESVSILDPELHQDKIHKLFVLDLCVKIRRMLNGVLARPEKVNVEVQTTSYKHFTDRVLAYSSRLYGNQLREGEGFDQLLPIYTLVFTTVNLREFKDVQDYCHICNLRRTEYPYAVMSKGMCFVIVELDKFRSELNHLLDKRDAWCYLLKNASNMNLKEYTNFQNKRDPSSGIWQPGIRS